MVSEIISEVEGERGALPLLAFAMSRLWEKRDRGRHLLTRKAYEEIGGVSGALAQHAESTLDRIGSARQGIVRELFRNLVTSKTTRIARKRNELLSLFEEVEKDDADEVLGELTRARLLNSFEDYRRRRRRSQARRDSPRVTGQELAATCPLADPGRRLRPAP